VTKLDGASEGCLGTERGGEQNRLHRRTKEQTLSADARGDAKGPIIAASDLYEVDAGYRRLGCPVAVIGAGDGLDSGGEERNREHLRSHFEVEAEVDRGRRCRAGARR